MLSVIMAYCNEYPQLVFTIRAIAEELLGRVDFEIIAINNYCAEVEAQGRKQDGGARAVKAAVEGNPWLRHLEYDTKLSHWQAKNLGVREARGEFLWFPDAHVIPSRDSLYEMFKYYELAWKELHGTLHMPIGYQILEWRRLIYGLVAKPEINAYSYQFVPFPEQNTAVFEVPCMTTCGSLWHRDFYDKLGGWPEEIGIYGGGEPFFNFAGAVIGLKRWIWPNGCLFHHGAERGYNWNFDGWIRDEMIAAYCYGGRDFLLEKIQHVDGSREVLAAIAEEVLSNRSIVEHAREIHEKQVIKIDEWVRPWLS